MRTLRLAISGLGRIGKIHLKNLCRNFPEVEVIGAMDVLEDARRIAEEFNVSSFVKTMDELLALPDLDGLVICSPTDTHADYVERAARAGKQVFCEKPLDLSLDRVKEVYAKGAVLVDPAIGQVGDIDTASIILTFADDTMAMIDNCRRAVYGYDQRLEVFGSKGMAQAENNFPNNHKLYTEAGVFGALPLHFFLERYDASYNLEMRAFIDALVSGTDMPVDGQDGLMSIALGLAAKQSVQENRPVKLSEII